jgi:hypothetical protein
MEFLFILFIIAAVVLPIIGGIVWLLIYFFAAKTVISAAERQFQQTLPNLEAMLSQIPTGGFSQLDPQQQNQITMMLMQANRQMSQLDDLSRQQYDVSVGNLMGMAAEAGIDWTPP